MSGNRILWGQITLVLAVVLATTWTATQWTAWRLGFQPQLGQPWFELAQGTPAELSNSDDPYVGELLRTPRRQAERLNVLLPRDGAA